MNIRSLSSWTIYRYRYLLGYIVLAAIAALSLVLYLDWVPSGLGPREQQSVVASSGVTFNQLPPQVIDLPYHALQKISVEFLGITPLGVRLPSLIFGALTALFVGMILRRWFQPNIAFLSAAIIITSGWLLSMARLGTPDIMVPFWTSLILLCATHVSQQSRGWQAWKVTLAFASALSLYTPSMAYLFIAAFIATLVQPHLRYLVRESGAFTVTIGLLCFMALLIPLGWGIYHNPVFLRELASLPASLPEPLTFLRGLYDGANNLLNPTHISTGETLTPALTVVTTVLLIMGGIRLLTDFHSVRAYVLLIWVAILAPIIAFSPQNFAVLFVPAMLTLAIGLNLIIRYWYRLFPRNPYARFFGVLPLFILMFSIIQLNYQRYFFGMMYDSHAGTVFKEDAFLVQKQLNILAGSTTTVIVVPEQDKPLYQIMLRNRPNSRIVNAAEATSGAGTWIVANSEIPGIAPKLQATPTKLLITDRKNNALRFWVYQL